MPVLEFHVSGVIQNLLFSFWLLSVIILFGRLLHVVCVAVVVLFNPVHIHRMNALIFILSILSLMENIWVVSIFLIVLNKVAMNVIIHVFCYILSSFGCIAKLYMLGSFVRLMFSFCNLCHIIPNDFLNGCTNLPAMYESTRCFTFSLVLGMVDIFKFSHPGWYAVVFLCFLFSPWLLMKLTPFHMCTGHLDILFYDMTIHMCWPLFLLSFFFP